ncbi:unnamed protein product, partial [Polarella glacialis]
AGVQCSGRLLRAAAARLRSDARRSELSLEGLAGIAGAFARANERNEEVVRLVREALSAASPPGGSASQRSPLADISDEAVANLAFFCHVFKVLSSETFEVSSLLPLRVAELVTKRAAATSQLGKVLPLLAALQDTSLEAAQAMRHVVERSLPAILASKGQRQEEAAGLHERESIPRLLEALALARQRDLGLVTGLATRCLRLAPRLDLAGVLRVADSLARLGVRQDSPTSKLRVVNGGGGCGCVEQMTAWVRQSFDTAVAPEHRGLGWGARDSERRSGDQRSKGTWGWYGLTLSLPPNPCQQMGQQLAVGQAERKRALKVDAETWRFVLTAATQPADVLGKYDRDLDLSRAHARELVLGRCIMFGSISLVERDAARVDEFPSRAARPSALRAKSKQRSNGERETMSYRAASSTSGTWGVRPSSGEVTDMQVHMIIPSKFIGTILGKKGSQITQITQDSGCKFASVTTYDPDEVDRRVVIIGGYDECARAQRSVHQLYVSAATAAAHEVSHVTVFLMVPQAAAGPVIGKEASNLKRIREERGPE